MKTQNDPGRTISPVIPILIGAGIGFLLISFFLMNAGDPNPEWSSYWRIRPLIIVTVAGAGGGFFFYLMREMRSRAGWRKVVSYFACLIVFIVGLWLGTVLGLAGTYWH